MTAGAGSQADNPFSHFGLQESFAIDLEDLERRYEALRSQLHPDRRIGAPSSERLLAERMSADLNQAYLTIKDPLLRAACLLKMRGSDPFDENDRNTMPVDFLERQMELRERLEDLGQAENSDLADALRKELAAEVESEYAALAEVFAQDDAVQSAVDAVRRLRYLTSCLAEAERLASG